MPEEIKTPDSNNNSSFTEKDLNDRVEKARIEEKQKLYAELEALRKQSEEAKVSAAKAEALQRSLEAKEAEIKALASAKTENGIDVSKVISEVAERTRKEVSEQTAQQVNELQTRLSSVEAERKIERLQSLRSSLISAAGGRIIEAMVVGNTEAELQESANRAKAQYEAIAAQVKGSSPTLPPGVSTRGQGGNGTPPPSGLDGFVRTRDPRKYGSQRSEILAATKQRFG